MKLVVDRYLLLLLLLLLVLWMPDADSCFFSWGSSSGSSSVPRPPDPPISPTANPEAIVNDACAEYNVLMENWHKNKYGGRNCSHLWKLFQEDIAPNSEKYWDFICYGMKDRFLIDESIVLYTAHPNESVVEFYANRTNSSLVTHYLPGYVMKHFIKRCGNKDTSNDNSQGSCPINLVDYRLIWKEVSADFAKRAMNAVRVLMNAGNELTVPYNKTTVFATHELPNLNAPQVCKICAILLHDEYDDDSYMSENCTHGMSIKQLKDEVENNKSMEFRCIDYYYNEYPLFEDGEDVLECKCNDVPDNQQNSEKGEAASEKITPLTVAISILTVLILTHVNVPEIRDLVLQPAVVTGHVI